MLLGLVLLRLFLLVIQEFPFSLKNFSLFVLARPFSVIDFFLPLEGYSSREDETSWVPGQSSSFGSFT